MGVGAWASGRVGEWASGRVGECVYVLCAREAVGALGH